MKVILFGSSGMIGQGVLRECLLDPEVESVLTVVRSATGQSHAKLRELVHRDFYDFSAISEKMAGYDACLFCLGVSSAGMKEAEYRRVTYDLAMAVAGTLVKTNPGMRFIFVSGSGTDSTGRGSAMWARVKGETENAIAKVIPDTYLFRPGFVQPMHGIKSRTRAYQIAHAIVGPLYPVWKRIVPMFVTNTEQVGKAMLVVAKHGAPLRVLENRDINRIAER